MILLDVKQYLKEKQQCSLQELSLQFHCQAEVMRDMLAHWMRKGVVVIAEKPTGCGVKCVQCQPELAEVYHYRIS